MSVTNFEFGKNFTNNDHLVVCYRGAETRKYIFDILHSQHTISLGKMNPFFYFKIWMVFRLTGFLKTSFAIKLETFRLKYLRQILQELWQWHTVDLSVMVQCFSWNIRIKL